MARPSLLITRSQPGAGRTAERASRLGFQTLINPLSEALETRIVVDLDPVEAIAVTSGHGLSALAQTITVRDKLLFAVGDQTADEARYLGFTQVRSASGDVEALAELIGQSVPSGSRILHARGERVAGDLKGRLDSFGIRLEDAIVYRMVSTNGFDPDTVKALTSHAPLVVVIHSPGGAELFLEAMDKAGLKGRVEDLTCVTISENAAENLIGQVRQIHIAPEPTDASILQTCLAITT